MATKPRLRALRAPANEPAPISQFIAGAVRAIAAGTASDHQQKEFLQWLVFKACAKAYPPFHETDRDTAFALGRHFVADQINGLLTIDLETLRRIDS